MTIEQTLGVALALLFLADIFLTVLYALAGTGLLAPCWNRGIWTLLHGVASVAGVAAPCSRSPGRLSSCR